MHLFDFKLSGWSYNSVLNAMNIADTDTVKSNHVHAPDTFILLYGPPTNMYIEKYDIHNKIAVNCPFTIQWISSWINSFNITIFLAMEGFSLLAEYVITPIAHNYNWHCVWMAFRFTLMQLRLICNDIDKPLEHGIHPLSGSDYIFCFVINMMKVVL